MQIMEFNSNLIASQRFRREAVAWKHLKHPNILPLLGANVRSERFSMASEWMDHGNINEFTEKHRKANRAQLVSYRVLLHTCRPDMIDFYSWWMLHMGWSICTDLTWSTEI